MTTTINITGDSNASNLVLDSNSSSVNGVMQMRVLH